ncbi:MAG: DUF3301 domain-containing protein, partial [Xanthomonadales bacterium]|nr:DUF3301 domain-containing protein [Xanthomonadales bacterium]
MAPNSIRLQARNPQRRLPNGWEIPQLSYFVLLSIFFGLAWLWLDGARARELAIGLAKSYCEKHDLQFLDETVALSRMALRWTN